MATKATKKAAAKKTAPKKAAAKKAAAKKASGEEGGGHAEGNNGRCPTRCQGQNHADRQDEVASAGEIRHLCGFRAAVDCLQLGRRRHPSAVHRTDGLGTGRNARRVRSGAIHGHRAGSGKWRGTVASPPSHAQRPASPGRRRATHPERHGLTVEMFLPQRDDEARCRLGCVDRCRNDQRADDPRTGNATSQRWWAVDSLRARSGGRSAGDRPRGH